MAPPTHNKQTNHTVLFQHIKKDAPPETDKTSKSKEKKPLSDFPVIKPGIGEKIICVQRRHTISIVKALAQQLFIFISLLVLLYFVAGFLQSSLSIDVRGVIIASYVVLAAMSLFSVSFIFIFMNWYYEFYIITNRSILHRNSFRLSGPYSDIVYIDKMHMREITRVPPNILYDFLKIEDVHIWRW